MFSYLLSARKKTKREQTREEIENLYNRKKYTLKKGRKEKIDTVKKERKGNEPIDSTFNNLPKLALMIGPSTDTQFTGGSAT